MQQYILYGAYNRVAYINQCRFSLLKYLAVYNLKPPATTTIVVYTDHPERFEAFIPYFTHFDIVAITKGDIQVWQGPHQLALAMKPAIIKQFLSSHSGNVLYFDSDTYITEPIEPIWRSLAANQVFLHHPKGSLAMQPAAVYKKWTELLHQQSIVYGDKQFQYNADLILWDSAVIGLPATRSAVLDDVIILAGKLYDRHPNKQAIPIALSYCLETLTTINQAEHTVVHYHRLSELDALLDYFFTNNEEESIPNLVKLSHHIQPTQIQQQKDTYDQLPFYKKWWQLLTGKNWSIRQYQHKI